MKSFGLLIGMYNLSKEHYLKDYTLCCTSSDVTAMESLLRSNIPFEELLCHNTLETLNWDYNLGKIQDLRDKIRQEKEECQLFIYYSGHGASIKYEHEQKQFLSFHDQLVIEEEILEQLYMFPSNCSIIVIVDACYSGGIPDYPEFQQIEQNQKRLIKDEVTIHLPIVKTISTDFGQIFDLHKETYIPKVKKYRNFNVKPQSNILFLLACGQDEFTTAGSECEFPSQFTNALVECAKFIFEHNLTFNYFGFIHELTKRNSKTRWFVTNIKNDNLFRTTKIFTNNQKIVLMEEGPIITMEILGRNVVFDLDLTVMTNYVCPYSLTWLYNSTNLEHDRWIKLVNTHFPDIKTNDLNYLSFIFLEARSPRNLPQPIRSLFTVDQNRADAGFGLIIPVDGDMNMITSIKPKRTKGKVSNKLG